MSLLSETTKYNPASARIGYALQKKIKSHLLKGGVIAYPTEFCFGLGCDPFNYRALKKIMHIKQRPQQKGLIVIGGKIEHIQMVLQTLKKDEKKQLEQIWPAPITFLLPNQSSIPTLLRGKGRNKLAVRIPQHLQAIKLCLSAKHPLVSTSANKSGQRPCKNTREITKRFKSKVLIVPGLIGHNKKPSTIIDFATQKIIRK